jgi:hypothetical protein
MGSVPFIFGISCKTLLNFNKKKSLTNLEVEKKGFLEDRRGGLDSFLLINLAAFRSILALKIEKDVRTGYYQEN